MQMARVAALSRALEYGLPPLPTQENGVLSQATEVLKNEALRDADFSVLSLESTFVKASPCAAGALKKRAPGDRSNEGRAQTKIHMIVAEPTIRSR